jgi:uncharacterized protein (TIGR00369 family)
VVIREGAPADRELAAPDVRARVAESFARQRLLQMFGATLLAIRPGEVEIALPFRDDLTQQHGFVHAAVVTAIADSACGYAALTLLGPGTEVLSVEFKVNLLTPAVGERFVAVGRVLRSGRQLSVCTGEARAITRASEKIVCASREGREVAVEAESPPA